MRALLLLLVATGASAQTPLEALYGAWEAPRDTAIQMLTHDGTAFHYRTLYEALDISETALTEINVTARLGDRAPTAYAFAFPYRIEESGLVLENGTRVQLRAAGGRLGMKWTRDGVVYPEVMMDRAASHDVPEALRGLWTTTAADEASTPLDRFVRIDSLSLTFGNADSLPVRYTDGLLLATSDKLEAEAGGYRAFRIFTLREDHSSLVLERDGELLRLVQP